MEIYLVRHGQTDWNYQGIVQGRENKLLNQRGILQAQSVAKKLQNLQPTMLVSSSLARAHETMTIINEANDWHLNIIEDDHFIERDFGTLEGQPVAKYYEVEDFSQVAGCETDAELERRLKLGLEKLIAKTSINDVIIIGCHSHVLKACLCLLKPKQYDYRYRLDNCAILQVKVKQQQLVDVVVYQD